jgi:hypothetical protein
MPMNKKEQTRQATALYDFLVKMDRFEAEALAEIDTMVRSAKHKASGITEKLYGPDSGIIERMLGTK